MNSLAGSVITGDIITGGKLETRCRRRDPDGFGLTDTEMEMDMKEEMDQLSEVRVHLGQVQLDGKDQASFADSRVSVTCPWLYPLIDTYTVG